MRNWIEYVRENLALTDARGDLEAEVLEEIASQLHDCYNGALARGASKEQADAEARAHVSDWQDLAADIVKSRRALVAPAVVRRIEHSEQSLRAKGGRWMTIADLLQEFRFAFRRLRRASGYSLVVLITLAVGIGATSAIFTLANAVLLQPLPYEEPEQLVAVFNTAPGLDVDQVPQSPALHFTYVDEAQVIDEIGLWDRGTVAVTGMDEATQEVAVWMTVGILPALRTQPVLGRRFSLADDTPGTPETAILSWDYWQTRFGGTPLILGNTIRVDGREREIIGVMPEGFRILDVDPAIYLPYRFDRSRLFMGQFSYQSVTRLKPGVTIEQATAEFSRLFPMAVEKFPGGMTMDLLRDAQAAPLLIPLKDDAVGNVGNVLWVLLGTAGIVLLIAAANVANLSLVRAEARDRELAVRTALGASRSKLALQFVLESATLGAVGGILGLGIAYGGLRMLVAMAPANLPRLHEISLNATAVCFTAVISILTGFCIGLLPILRNRDFSLVKGLKEGGRGAGSGKDRHQARNGLVVVQMALALVLLVGSGLMIRSFQALRSVNPGFRDPEAVLTLRITIPAAEVGDLVEMAAMHEQIARNIGDLPGVTSVALTSSVTMGIGNSNDPVFVEDFPLAENQMPPIRRFKWIGPSYFETMRNPVLAGRDFTWDDIRLRPPVTIVTENFAREYWGEPSAAIGKRISSGMTGADWREIVGVVGNIRDDGVAAEPTSTVYWPMLIDNPFVETTGAELFSPRTMAYAIRSERTGTAGLLDDVRRTVRSVNSNLPLANVRTLSDVLARSTTRTSFTLAMLGIAAAVALLLGTVGVYGVISYVVSQRTREMGVRKALGAQTSTLLGMVMRHGFALAAIGVAVGLAASFAATRLMTGLLFGVDPVDPVTYSVVALALTGVAMVASYLPARRAAKIDPTEALRAE
jgi:predicted permease